jgi:UDP-N-acetylmuramyl pentapeptide synthase
VFYPEIEELIQNLKKDLREDAVVLVKGSRSQRMERVIDALCRA